MKASEGRVLTATLVAASLSPLNATIMAVAIPGIGTTFGTPSARVTMGVVTVALIANLVFLGPAGNVSDRIGSTRALGAGRWLVLGGSLLSFAAPTFSTVVLGRLVISVGATLLGPAATGIVQLVVAPARRLRAFGAMASIFSCASAVGPALGGLLASYFGWRAVFLLNVPLAIGSWLLERWSGAPNVRPPTSVSAPFDLLGSVLLAATLVLMVVATRTPAPLVYAVGLGAALGLAALVTWERKAQAPVIDVTLFRRPALSGAALVTTSQSIATTALLFQLPFLTSVRGGTTESTVGVVMMVMTLGMMATAPLGSRLAERIGIRATVFAGSVVGALGVALITTRPLGVEPTGLLPQLLIVALGLGLSGGPTNAAAVAAVDEGRSGMGSSVLSMARRLGGIVGTTILAATLAGPEAVAASRHRTALWLFAGAFALAAGASLLLPGRPASRS